MKLKYTYEMYSYCLFQQNYSNTLKLVGSTDYTHGLKHKYCMPNIYSFL
jgi:hypothetical protein